MNYRGFKQISKEMRKIRALSTIHEHSLAIGFAFTLAFGYVSAMALPRLNWNKRNHETLKSFLAGVRPGEIAVFDWDNTCIFGDIGEAVLRHQALHLEFKFGPERLREIIPEQVQGIGHILSNGRSLPLSGVKGQIISAYEKIFGRALTEIRDSADLRDFSVGLLALNRGLEETPGIGCEFAYPWAIHFLQGYGPDEVNQLAELVIGNELPAPLRNRCLRDSRGQLHYRWVEGIRPFPEMADLALCLKKTGGRVIISTASNPLIVETMARRIGFAADHVIGMAAPIENNTLSITLAPGQAPNFGPGKAENLRRQLDREPCFVAGDSSGDYEMLTAFPGTRLKLLIRREQPGKLVSLYRQALAGDRCCLLQGVDRSAGIFSAAVRPAMKSDPEK